MHYCLQIEHGLIITLRFKCQHNGKQSQGCYITSIHSREGWYASVTTVTMTEAG
jgi:hypothetical protein